MHQLFELSISRSSVPKPGAMIHRVFGRRRLHCLAAYMYKEVEAADCRWPLLLVSIILTLQYTITEQHRVAHHLLWHEGHVVFGHEAVKADAGCTASHSLKCESIQAPQLHAQAAGLEVTVLQILKLE